MLFQLSCRISRGCHFSKNCTLQTSMEARI
jgi:hypothetical protein